MLSVLAVCVPARPTLLSVVSGQQQSRGQFDCRTGSAKGEEAFNVKKLDTQKGSGPHWARPLKGYLLRPLPPLLLVVPPDEPSTSNTTEVLASLPALSLATASIVLGPGETLRRFQLHDTVPVAAQRSLPSA